MLSHFSSTSVSVLLDPAPLSAFPSLLLPALVSSWALCFLPASVMSSQRRHPHLQPSVVETAFESLLHPGIGRGTITVLNLILLALVGSIACMFLAGLGSYHTGVLLFLAAGLLLSINIFTSRLLNNNPQHTDGQEEDVRKAGQGKTDDEDDGSEGPAHRTRSRSRQRELDSQAAAAGVKTRSSRGGEQEPATTTTSSGSKKKRTKRAD
jgi:hypothetical protein